jgi:hypothetical protein
VPEPIRRTTARVLPVNTQGEALLLQDQDPSVRAYHSDSTFFGLLLDREVSEDMPWIMRSAVRAVLDGAR